MSNPEKYIKPYEQAFFTPIPGKLTRFFRTNFIWQSIRFIAINYKMVRMIMKSHH
jgi:hypothetical protein